MASILEKALRVGEGRTLKKLDRIAQHVERLADVYDGISREDAHQETERFKERIEAGEKLDDILPEAFALVREAATQVLEQRHFHVQLMGGAALHMGNIAEMKTGEGKTLVATLPAYLNALSGKGVHVVTVNDYLASYQSELMGRVYSFLGMSTGCITSGLTPDQRRVEYAADITYGTNNEFGFDYLRDNMAQTTDELVQRGHNFAIVDEVDSILIDEARTPLIISGPATGDLNKLYKEFATIARRLTAEVDYEVDEKKRTVGILEPGIEKVEDHFGMENLYESLNTPYIQFLNNAIKAKELFKRDKDYIIQGGEVLIVDEHTGRVLPGRRYNEGMHQAIEAKEGVAIKAENQTLATITLQNYFRLYSTLSGMTGTAETEAAEFYSTYQIGVIPIPTNEPMVRIDQPDVVYKTPEAKYMAVVQDIAERHEQGQPVLVGTTSVENNELLSKLLKRQGVPHQLLNAKHHDQEAKVVAMAGRRGAVTVATNMAGRGTDIMLGGNFEFIADEEMKKRGLDPIENADEYDAVYPQVLASAKQTVAEEHNEVASLGGLYVLGTERHESRRIDNQLRGRSGRQGDPGESRFYLSLGDDLMRLFNSQAAESLLARGGFPDDVPLESKLVSRAIKSAQSQVEARNFEIRKNVLKYDDVMSRQREVVYAERRRVLEGEDMRSQIRGFIEDVVRSYVNEYTVEGDAHEWDLDALWTTLKQIFPVSISPDDVIEEVGGPGGLTTERLSDELVSDALLCYENREQEFGEDVMRDLERRATLAIMDGKWREHLYEMDYLKEGIGLRAMAQRDPLVEYQREGFQMYQAMSEAVREETVRLLFNYQPVFEEAPEAEQAQEDPTVTTPAPEVDESEAGGGVALGVKQQTVRRMVDDAPKPNVRLQYSGPGDPDGTATATATKVESDGVTYPGTPRNAQCPCGSGKKYKLCHGKNE